MRLVPVKSAENQAALAQHKTRELLIKQRTMSINALRAQLAEFGLVAAKGPQNVAGLIETARGDETLPQALREIVADLESHIGALSEKIAALEKKIASLAAREPMVRLLRRIPGVGKLGAAAIIASLPDPGAFESGRDFSAWLGLTPRQNSSGGKDRLGAITKRGNAYLRKLLVMGATALLPLSKKRTGALADWITALCARKPRRLASVAIANKLARIVHATMRSGECFRKENFARA
jgi:transposase